MDKRILRLPEMMNRLGLSRSAIYDRMDKKSDRYDPTFPKKTRLGDRQGSAIGWCEVDVEAWLASRPEDTQAVASRRAAKPSPIPPKPKRSRAEPKSPPSRASSNQAVSVVEPSFHQQNQPSITIAEIFHGLNQNAYLAACLRLNTWTPIMGALLASGIKVPEGCCEIPLGGEGVDGQLLHASDARFHRARSILKKWNEKNIEFGDDETPHHTCALPSTISPIDFFIWCDEEQIDSSWLRLIREIAGCPSLDEVRCFRTGLAQEISQSVQSNLCVGNIDDKANHSEQPITRTNQVISPSSSDVEQGVTLHRLQTKIDGTMDKAIRKAKEMAEEPDNYKSVYFELIKMTLSPDRPKDLLKYTEETGIEYQEWGEDKVFTRNALRTRMQRERKRAEKLRLGKK